MPDIIIGLELARQAGNSVFLAPGVHHGRFAVVASLAAYPILYSLFPHLFYY
ncbi:UNVERIFIED_ORG: hypothetical protein J3D59_004108 [Pseudomonas fluorescens]